MSLKFTVGDLAIHRLIEQETTFLPVLDMLPGLTPELLAENKPWMQKAGAIDADAYEIEVAGVRQAALASLRPLYDPKQERIRR